MRRTRDVEKDCSSPQFVAKLRRLADSLESGRKFSIQIAGHRIHVPERATLGVEHERSADDESIEFQLTWKARGR